MTSYIKIELWHLNLNTSFVFLWHIFHVHLKISSEEKKYNGLSNLICGDGKVQTSYTSSVLTLQQLLINSS